MPDTWTNDLPTGAVDQDELDGVLLNCGNTSTAAVTSAAVPEPGTGALLIIFATIAGAFVRSAKGPVIPE